MAIAECHGLGCVRAGMCACVCVGAEPSEAGLPCIQTCKLTTTAMLSIAGRVKLNLRDQI